MGYQATNRPGGGGGGGGSDIIWRWNETDTSQFQIAKDDIAGGAAALSVVNQPWGPVLRLDFPSKVTGNQAAFVTVNDADLDLAKDANDLIRYEILYRIVGFAGVISEWYSQGPVFLCNRQVGAGFYGIAMTDRIGTATRLIRVDAGSTKLSGSTPNWAGNPINTTPSLGATGEFVAEIMAKHPAASPPGFKAVMRAVSVGSSRNIPDQRMDDAYFAAQVGAFTAGWNAETLDSIGMAILGGTGTTPGHFDFDAIAVRRSRMVAA